MSNLVYYLLCALLTIGVLVGISLLSKVKTARLGNTISGCSMTLAILVTMLHYRLISLTALWICLTIGLVLGLIGAAKVKMIQMPQAVALLNGFGGAASALVAVVFLLDAAQTDAFSVTTAGLALVVGWITFSGSAVAAGKLHKLIDQHPVIWKGHKAILTATLLAVAVLVIALPLVKAGQIGLMLLLSLLSLFFGVAFAIRVGGADMPITISLLNSLSGVAGSIAGMAIAEPLLVAVGGIVGASGVILTQIMCRGMNRSLADILMGKTSVAAPKGQAVPAAQPATAAAAADPEQHKEEALAVLSQAKKVIIVPGYGMALAQAQALVKQLTDALEARGAEVKFAIHPVAGRMPGHMNVLLCEVDIPYEQLYEMNDINDEFAQSDITIVIGANDVINPAANTAEGTPIYGMPVLRVAEAPQVLICNYDRKPGYAGVDNPLYTSDKAVLLLGDALETLPQLLAVLQ